VSRVCVVGMGVPSFVRSRAHEGPGLRCGHFVTALARAGHELLVLQVAAGRRGRTAAPVERAHRVDGHAVVCVDVAQADFEATWLVDRVASFAPDVLVGATAYAAALATKLDLDIPMWADVFGDPMAEAQAKAAACGNDLAVARFWATLQPVLERADRFSAVSRAQSDALLGQLGVFGRLGQSTAGERLVSVIPCAAEAEARDRRSAPALRGSVVPDDAFVALWSGSFNTWCDVETAVAGVAAAMARDPSIHLVATGGSVDGHDEQTYPRFRRLVERTGRADRFHLLGRVDDDRLPGYYADADVGINIERELYERRLGSENRVVHWAAAGLPCVTTGLSELGRSLSNEGLCFTCTSGDSSSLADVLVALAADRVAVGRVGERCRRFAAEHFSYDATAVPLVEWAAVPVAAGDRGRERAVAIGMVSEPATMVPMLERYLADLSLGQLVYRSTRWLWRRLLGAQVTHPPR